MATTVKQLRSLAKARKIPKYSRLNKAQLLSQLGMHEEAKAHATSRQANKVASQQSSKLADGNATKRAQLKGRILRSVKRELIAHEQKLGRKLTQEEKRAVAGKALAAEVKAIKAGKPENKPKRGGKPKPKFSIQAPPDGMSVAEYRAHLRRQHGAETGSRIEQTRKKEERRAEVALGDPGGRSQASILRDMERNGKVSYPTETPKSASEQAISDFATGKIAVGKASLPKGVTVRDGFLVFNGSHWDDINYGKQWSAVSTQYKTPDEAIAHAKSLIGTNGKPSQRESIIVRNNLGTPTYSVFTAKRTDLGLPDGERYSGSDAAKTQAGMRPRKPSTNTPPGNRTRGTKTDPNSWDRIGSAPTKAEPKAQRYRGRSID